MRIVHLSDLHLSSENITDLRNYYLDALIGDLILFHNHKPIDIILITGDLIDKGGHSLGIDPYLSFQNEIINPIIKSLKISKNQILMIPGNHDIDRSEITEKSEFFLAEKLTKEGANKLISEMKVMFSEENSRIKKFKEFEKEFHQDNDNYLYSNAESSMVVKQTEGDIGIALINDSWRCSNDLSPEKHFIGSHQLFSTAKTFMEAKTQLNIAVFHHPLDSINDEEKDEIENILRAKNFSFAFFGHSHKYKYQNITTATGGYIVINGRAGLHEPAQQLAAFQPGYNILDVHQLQGTYDLYARKFVRTNSFSFDADVDSLPGGKTSGLIPITEYYQLAKNSKNQDKDLPDGYTADVDRIVTLLIGKSIYPNPYIFVRELIQNSVDACNRLREFETHANPKITININRSENYLECVDEGDGMSKFILKNHFSVIGKSISQEYNDSTGHFNLISQFGIGFISTFIIAQKVCVTTKRNDGEIINFEVTNVFKGFEYSTINHTNLDGHSGTAIKVYLKKGNEASQLLPHIISYCRHIDNLEITLDGAIIGLSSSWNIEGCHFMYHEKNSRFELRIGIGISYRDLFTSNSGFIINTHGRNAFPFRFPGVIGGEVNFRPRAIDFDVSRNNILDNEKSFGFRREISVFLRKLFRDTLERGQQSEIETVLQYICYYIEYYDANEAKMTESYTDFYSKRELLDIFSKNSRFSYGMRSIDLISIFQELKQLGIYKIYTVKDKRFEEHEEIVLEYLRDNGNFVMQPINFNVQFHDGGQTVNMLNVLHIIASTYGFSITDVFNVKDFILQDMKEDKSSYSPKLVEHISSIETRHKVKIDIADFRNSTKPSIRYENQLLLNKSHESFKSLVSQIENSQTEKIDVYLLGLLGLQLN